tara:strand:+ start:3840 stop:4298 length:459 start_codon:yes stop_codon:yes gene_type:complete
MVKKIKVLKFTNNKEIVVKNCKMDKGILVDGTAEGYVANPHAFTELQAHKLWGFIKPKPDKINGCFIVREDAPDPLQFTAKGIFGEPFTQNDLIYHEDESLARSMALVEERNSMEPDFLQKNLVKVLLIEAISVLVLVIAVGLPEILSNYGF